MSSFKLNPLQKQEQKKHVDQALHSYVRLARNVLSLVKQTGKVSDPKKKFVQLAKTSPEVNQFLDTFIGTLSDYPFAKSFRAKSLYALRDHLLGFISLNEAKEIIKKNTMKSYIHMTLSKAQANISKVLPPELKAFLPPNITIETDDSGMIRGMADLFGNERDTLRNKVELVRKIVIDYNKIVGRIKKDLKSSNDRTKFKALVTSILMETGIRPGREGNKSKVAGIEVETFGAVTLSPQHITFIKANFAELRFVGKGGGLNVTHLKDRSVIKILKSYAKKSLTNKLDRVFVDKGGVPLSHVEINYYFQDHFGSIKPSDLRKYKATEQMYEALKEGQLELQKKILGFVEEAAVDLKEKVLQEIVNTLNSAVTRSQQALSHVKGADTIGYYINPDVVLTFLSQGFVEEDIKGAIIRSERYLSFDVDTFIAHAISKKASKPKSILSIYLDVKKMFL